MSSQQNDIEGILQRLQGQLELIEMQQQLAHYEAAHQGDVEQEENQQEEQAPIAERAQEHQTSQAHAQSQVEQKTLAEERADCETDAEEVEEALPVSKKTTINDVLYPRVSPEFLEYISRELKNLRDAKAQFQREKEEARSRAESDDSTNSNNSGKVSPSPRIFPIEEIKKRLHEILKLSNNQKIQQALAEFEIELRQGKFNINESVIKKTNMEVMLGNVAPGHRTLLDEFLCRSEKEVGVKLIVEFLLKLGANVNNDATDRFPADYTLKRKNLEILSMLMQYNLDPNLQLDTRFIMDPASMDYGRGIPGLEETYDRHFESLPQNSTALECLTDPFYSVEDRRKKYKAIAMLLRSGADITPRVFFNLFGRGAHELLKDEMAQQDVAAELAYQRSFDAIQLDRKQNSDTVYSLIQNNLIIKLMQSDLGSDVNKMLDFILRLINDVDPQRSYNIFCRLKEEVIMQVVALQSDQIKTIGALKDLDVAFNRGVLRYIMEYAFELEDFVLHPTCNPDLMLRNAFTIAYNDRIKKSHSFSSTDELVFGMEDTEGEFSNRGNGTFWLFSGYDPRIDQLLKKQNRDRRYSL